MFAKAIKGGYAIPAFNFNNMEQMQAIIKAAVETKSPVILQVSKGARQYANATLLRYMAPVSYTHLDVYKRQPFGWKREDFGDNGTGRFHSGYGAS